MITGCDISISVFLVGIVAGEAKRSYSTVCKVDVNKSILGMWISSLMDVHVFVCGW